MSAPSIPAAIGLVIRRYRLELGISQEDFADLVGMHRTQYGAIEQGRKDCQLSTLLRLSRGLGIPLGQLARDIEALSP
ncbi:MAG TPA: helix-turn-helix transcriptional regulator [Lysobacter sp.]